MALVRYLLGRLKSWGKHSGLLEGQCEEMFVVVDFFFFFSQGIKNVGRFTGRLASLMSEPWIGMSIILAAD